MLQSRYESEERPEGGAVEVSPLWIKTFRKPLKTQGLKFDKPKGLYYHRCMARTWHERLEAKTLKYKKRVRQGKADQPQYINKTEAEALSLEEKFMQIPKEKYKQLLLSKRVIRGDCWIWTGTESHGYGTTWMTEVKSNARTHVLALFLFRREKFSFKRQVNHTCNNKRCFNPDHLYAGTQTENMHDYFNPKQQDLKDIFPRMEI